MVYLLKIVIFYSYVKLPGRVNPMISWKIRPRHEANVTGRWASFDGDADRVADPVKILGKLWCFVAVHCKLYVYTIYIIYMRYIILIIYMIYIVYIIYICFDMKLHITKWSLYEWWTYICRVIMPCNLRMYVLWLCVCDKIKHLNMSY